MIRNAPGLASTVVFHAFELHGNQPELVDAYLRERCEEDAHLLNIARQQARIEHLIRQEKFLHGNAAESLFQTVREGTVIDDFRVGREIGRGAMGTVYQALQISVNRAVALKVLHNSLGAQAASRFVAEARALGGIRSARVVEIYYYGQFAGRPYIAMEYFNGLSLQETLDQESLASWQSRIATAIEIATALKEIHAMNIAHRDIKPSNVLVRGLEIKIVDFGIAWRESSGETLIGQALGTPAYMPPEQILRKLGGPATGFGQYKLGDIYSFGILLFELLAGERPFVGETREEIENQIVNLPVPLERLRRIGAPESIAEAIGRATEKEPAVRMREIEEMIRVLRASLLDTTRPDTTPDTTRSDTTGSPGPYAHAVSLPGRTAIVIMAAAVVLLLAISAWIAKSTYRLPLPVFPVSNLRAPAPPGETTIAVPGGTALTTRVSAPFASPTADHRTLLVPEVSLPATRGAASPPEDAPEKPAPADTGSTAPATSVPPEDNSAGSIPAEVLPTSERSGASENDRSGNPSKYSADSSERNPGAPAQWARLQNNFDTEKLLDFARTFPEHPLAAVADSVRRQLENRSRARSAINATLDAYTAAMASLKMPRIEAFREMSADVRTKVKGMIDAASRVEMTLKPTTEVDFDQPLRENAASAGFIPQTASLECQQRIRMVDRNGDDHPPVTRDVTVNLKRKGQVWIIASIR